MEFCPAGTGASAGAGADDGVGVGCAGFEGAAEDSEAAGLAELAGAFLGGMGRILPASGALLGAGDPVATLVGFCADACAVGVTVTVTDGGTKVFVFVTRAGVLDLVGRTISESPSGTCTGAWVVAAGAWVSVTVTVGGVLVTVTVMNPFPPAPGLDPCPPVGVVLGARAEDGD